MVYILSRAEIRIKRGLGFRALGFRGLGYIGIVSGLQRV